ncbi:MAG: zinc metallopeptidase [Oscillospiraceae bacterium]|nr:zinc metallopeptidase [Oscillospiraceae bacterium]
MFYFDYYYWILILPAALFAMWAQMRVQSTFRRYSKTGNLRGLTGAGAARMILDANGLQNIRLEHISGNLTDHYDPRNQVIRLSDSVWGSSSVAAVGVAAHEAGHAVQHAVGYFPIKIRTAVIPVTNIGSKLSIPLILLGIFFQAQPLVSVGILLFATVALFQLVTLPVEYNASGRAMKVLEQSGMLMGEELTGARKVLSAAALTYVAALITALAQLLRLVMLFGRRNDD